MAAVVFGCFLLVWLRLGNAGPRGVLWAEDGTVFMSRAYTSNIVQSLLEPYAGYGHVVPRLAAELASWLPLTWQGTALTVEAAVVQALVATLVYLVLMAHVGSRPVALIGVLVAASPPVGFETIGNIANAQWYLIAAGVLVIMWEPGSLFGRIVACGTILAATLCSPFGAGAVVLAGIVAALTRSRPAWAVVASGLVGAVTQALVMLSTTRTQGLHHTTSLARLVKGYVERVVDDGVLGSTRQQFLPDLSTFVLTGVIAVAVLVVVALVVVRDPSALLVPIVLFLASFSLYVAPVVLDGVNVDDPGAASRYYVAPVVLMLLGLILLGFRAWSLDGAMRPAGRVPVIALLALLAFGVLSNWRPLDDPRLDAPGWSDVLRQARVDCRTAPQAVVPVTPPNFAVTIPCAELRR